MGYLPFYLIITFMDPFVEFQNAFLQTRSQGSPLANHPLYRMKYLQVNLLWLARHFDKQWPGMDFCPRNLYMGGEVMKVRC